MVTLLRSFLNFLYQRDASKSLHRFFKLYTFNRNYFLLIALFSTVTNIASAQHNYFIKQSYHSPGSPANDYNDSLSLTDYALNGSNASILEKVSSEVLGTDNRLFSSKVPLSLGPGFSTIYTFTVNYRVRNGNTAGISKINIDTLKLQTSPLKPPVNLTGGNQQFSIGNKIIKVFRINWQKSSNIPDYYLSYRVYKRDSLINTLSTADNSTDTNYSYGQTIGVLDGSFDPNVPAVYRVETRLNVRGQKLWPDWGDKPSQSTIYSTVAASDNAQGRVTLKWGNISSAADKIKIYRNDDELAVLDSTSTSYSDADGVPGKKYSYTLEAIKTGKTIFTASDTGYTKPIGKIYGNVKTKQGSGVAGVVLTATSLIEGILHTDTVHTDATGYYQLNALYFGADNAKFTITPSFKDHKFNLFSQSRTLDISLPTASGVDFTDTTALTVKGMVQFSAMPVYTKNPQSLSVYLPVPGAEIFLNGKSTGVKTAKDGSYAISVNDQGTYTLQAKLYSHKIVSAVHSIPSNSVINTINVTTSLTDINFLDMNSDTLTIRVLGGSKGPIGEFATVRLTSVNTGKTLQGDAASVNQNIRVNAANGKANIGIYDAGGNLAPSNGTIKLILPATAFNVQIDSINIYDGTNSTVKQQYFKTLSVIDLSKRDSLSYNSAAGSKTVIPLDTVSFIYHDKIQISPDYLSVFPTFPLASNNAAQIIVAQNDVYPVPLQISEYYEYHGTTYLAQLDSGVVHVVDGVGDIKDRQDLAVTPYKSSTSNAKPIYNLVNYKMKIGEPNITAPYRKSFQVSVESGTLKSDVYTTAMVVTGQKPRTGTFLTTTPNIPFFVLHDPPGSSSYTSLSKGSTYATSISSAINIGGSAGVYVDSRIGVGASTPFTGAIGTDVTVSASAEAGGSSTKNQSTNFNLTFNEGFSTSADPGFIGSDGDVYIGGSLNVKLAKTDVLTYNIVKHLIEPSTSIAFDYTGFNTTYNYTEYHIKNAIIPQLQSLINQLTQNFNRTPASDSTAKTGYYNQLLQNRASLKAWQVALSNNAKARERAKDKVVLPNNPAVIKGNISFSAGAAYDNSLTTDTVTASSTDIDVFVNADAKLGFEIIAGDFNSLAAGATIGLRFNQTNSSGTSSENTKTIAYHLEDSNAGNYYSVGLYVDSLYGTPVFRTVAGASSCPHEDGTQYRAKPSISITTGTATVQSNVPAAQPAKFQITISNQSESEETQQYSIKLDPSSNPNGAKVLVAGQDATNSEAVFNLPYNKAFTVPVEVSRGALSNDYAGLKLVMYPTCESAYTDVFSDSTILTDFQNLDVHFQSSCSTVDLFNPGPNWLVNQANKNQLQVTFSSYDASSGSILNKVGIQYKKLNTLTGSQWATIKEIQKSELTDKFKDLTIDVSGFDDGQYQLQAYAVCSDNSINYSPIYSGTIDRKSAVAYGVPSPANGILTLSDNISVTFNKTIACDDKLNPVKATLTRADNGQQIPVTYACSGTGIQIKTIPENAINNLENVGLIASLQNVKDASGNLIKDTLSWRFVVKRSDVYWDPANIVMNATESRDTSFATKLRNRTANEQTFSLTKFPTWLKPTVSSGKIPPLGELNIGFAVDSHLNTGEYIDTVTAVVNGKSQYLYVDVTVLRTPPVWRVNPAAYKYSMNITAQFSRNETDTLISKDTRDKIAVFSGNECRGVGFIQYDDNLKKYVAFITAYSNTSGTEQLAFRLWDAYPGIEYQSVERLNFISNAIVGSTASPYIAHAGGVYQSIILKKGWNWISLNVMNTDMSVRTALASLKSTPGDEIKTLTSNAYSQYADKLGWVGKLDSISLYSGYMINVAHDDTLRVLGEIQRSPVRIQLNKGWSWIGYPMPINISLTSYLKNFNPSDKDIVVSQEEFAQYNAATKSWSGSLQFLRPGKAYKVYSNNGISVPAFTNASQDNDATYISALINQPANTPVIYNNPQGAISSTIDPFLKVNSTDFKNNMTITAIISQDGGRVNDISRYEIRLSINSQLVSISGLTRLPNDQAVAFIPVYGNDNQEGQKVDVVIYDKQNQKQYPITISAIKGTLPTIQNQNGSGLGVLGPVTPSKDIYQQQDAILGTVEVPKIFALNGQADISVTTALNKQQMSVGDTALYTLHLKNGGPDAGLNVVLADTLNTSFDYISSNTSSLVYNNSTRTFSLSYPKMLLGEQHDIIVSLRANKVGQFNIGQSSITLDNDPMATNNRALAIAVEVTDKRANEAKIFIPGLFTPNGDGINDRFVIVGLNDYYPSNTLIIYNKNYNEVYHKVNYQNDWSGNNLPMGSYAYFLKVTSATGIEKVFKGYITIAY